MKISAAEHSDRLDRRFSRHVELVVIFSFLGLLPVYSLILKLSTFNAEAYHAQRYANTAINGKPSFNEVLPLAVIVGLVAEHFEAFGPRSTSTQSILGGLL